MMMVFNIESSPPSKANLDAALVSNGSQKVLQERRVHRLAELKRKSGLVSLLVLALIVALALVGVKAWVFVGLYAIELCLWGACSMLLHNAARQLEVLTGVQKGLSPIDPSEAPALLALCQRHKALADYQSLVSDQNRTLVGGEAEAMRRWATSIDSAVRASENESKAQVAFARLRAPVAG